MAPDEAYCAGTVVARDLRKYKKVGKALYKIRDNFLEANKISAAYTFVNFITNPKSYNNLTKNGFEHLSNEEAIMTPTDHDNGDRALLVKPFIIRLDLAQFKQNGRLNQKAAFERVNQIIKKYNGRLKTSNVADEVYTFWLIG